MHAQRHLGETQRSLERSFERLASGRRINSASDDAGGIALSVSLDVQIRSYAIAERNTMNGISMVETAEGALGLMSRRLSYMRGLATQAANGDLTDKDRGNLNTEYMELLQQVHRDAMATEFNGIKLLYGTPTTIDFQVGIGTSASDTIHVVAGYSKHGALTSIGKSSISTLDKSKQAIDVLDGAVTGISQIRASLGATTNRLRTAASNASTMRINLAAAHSHITDADYAAETARLTRASVLQSVGAAVLAQANVTPRAALMLQQNQPRAGP